MAENKAAWGIDIGQSALKAIKVRYVESAKQIVAEAFDYIQFPKILSQPDAVPHEIVPEAMKTFLGRNDLKGDLVAISVPGQSALARFIQLPPVEAKKLPEIVKYEARQQIPFALEDVIWDYQPLGGGNEESGFLIDAEVGLFAMKRDQVFQQLAPYTAAKIEVELVQIASLALYGVLGVDELGIRRDSAAEPGDEYYIVLDMGCDNTTLMVSNGFKIWIRNVPIGGNHFTRALTKEMKLSFAKAEHLKCNATKSQDPRAVFQALRPVFNDYVSEIQRSIGYFSSVNRQAKIAKVIGTGNAFKLAGLQKFLQQNLQYEVERPDAFKTLAGDTVINSPLFSENILSFTVPYGLALQALGLTRIRTTLLPPEITRARIVRKKKPWALATAASVLGLCTISTLGNASSNAVVNTADWAAAEKQAEEFGAVDTGFKSAYTTATGEWSDQYAKIDSLVLGRKSIGWLDIYNAVNDALPVDEEGIASEDLDITLKHQISLTEFSSEKSTDVSTWWAKLSDANKAYLAADDDKEAGPSGEGYIFTLRGQHWHDNPERPDTETDIGYIKHFFLANLQKPTIKRPGWPERPVRNLGIKYATIMNYQVSKVIMPSPGPRNEPVSRFAGNTPGGMGGVGGGYAGPSDGLAGMPGDIGGIPGVGGGLSGAPTAGGNLQTILNQASAGQRGPGGGAAYGSGIGGTYEGGAAYGGPGGAGAYGSGGYDGAGYGAGAGAGGVPANPYAPTTIKTAPSALGASGMEIRQIDQTDFVIQFIYTPPGAAEGAEGEAAAEGTEAAGEATEATATEAPATDAPAAEAPAPDAAPATPEAPAASEPPAAPAAPATTE